MAVHVAILLPAIMMFAFPGLAVSAVPLDRCRRKCGEVSIPYPFGLSNDNVKQCYLGEDFSLTCNSSFHPAKPFLGTNIEVISINPASAQMSVLFNLSYRCYNNSGQRTSRSSWTTTFSTTYTLSSTENVFTAIGCDTSARFRIGTNKFGGCISGCNSINDVADGFCSGIGCCRASIPLGANYYRTSFSFRDNDSKAYLFNNCSYSFISQRGYYTFRKSDLQYMYPRRSFPVVLDFAVDNKTCEEAKKNASSYACLGHNSICVASANGTGYVCNCSKGYQGNPYIQDGCRDIDECKLTREVYPCYGICTNVPGSYSCTCPEGYYAAADPKKFNCTRNYDKAHLSLTAGVPIGIGFGIMVLLGCVLVFRHRRQLKILRKKNFEIHGGSVLEKLLSKDGRNFRIFSVKELERATNDFHEDQILGTGGFGTVYKGTLDDKRLVAIKKAKVSSEKKVGEDLANELYILSKVNHKHVVELLGCCLDDEVPMLVCKFVPGGTLFNFIHGMEGSPRRDIPFVTRLQIAVQAAEAFKYLHIYASTPIFHGDVKSANILLDDGPIAKVSDFGTSKLSPPLEGRDQTEASRVQYTLGYCCPEYLSTGRLTDKTDVYSFGVVIVELITRKKPVYRDSESNESRSLAVEFLASMKNHTVREILDPDILDGDQIGNVERVADVAMRCLDPEGKNRPTMREVVRELEAIRVPEMQPSDPNNLEQSHQADGEAPLLSDHSHNSSEIEQSLPYHTCVGQSVTEFHTCVSAREYRENEFSALLHVNVSARK